MKNSPESTRPGMLEVLDSMSFNKTKLVATLLIGLFWVICTYPFVVQLFSDALCDRLFNPMLMLTDVVILLLGVLTLRNRWDVAVLVSYLVISLISSFGFNHLSLTYYLNGSRMYFCMLFLPPAFRYLMANRARALYFITLFDRSLYIFLWLQLPALTYQMLRYGAGDRGGGTLGNLFSGAISTLIYSISFYFQCKRWNSDLSYIRNLWNNKWLVFLLVPTFMNETKISFIYLFLYFLFLIPFDRRFIRNLVVIVPAAALLLGLGGYVYVKTNPNQELAAKLFDLEYLEFYVMGNEDILNLVEFATDSGYLDDDIDFMRGVKYMVLPVAVEYADYGPWIGYGVSQFKGGSHLEMTDFYRRFEWFLHGTCTQLMQILIDMGLAGFLWMLFWVGVLFGWIGKSPGRKEKRTQIYFTIVMLMSILYMNYLSLQTFMLVFVYLCMASTRWQDVRASQELEQSNQTDLSDLSDRSDLSDH